jgi:hypothetical protein
MRKSCVSPKSYIRQQKLAVSYKKGANKMDLHGASSIRGSMAESDMSGFFTSIIAQSVLKCNWQMNYLLASLFW